MAKENDNKVIELINALIKELPGYIPFDVNLKSTDAEQKMGMANAFAIRGFREYLLKTIRHQVTSIIDVKDMEGLWVVKGRILALRELYRACESFFEDSEKLRKALISDKTTQ